MNLFETSNDIINEYFKDKEVELTKLIYNNYILYYLLKYEQSINEGKESENFFIENMEKLKIKEYKNKWIDQCSKILSNKKCILLLIKNWN